MARVPPFYGSTKKIVEKQLIEGDRLYLIAESLAKDFSLFPPAQTADIHIPGLLSQSEINRLNEHLLDLDTDAYIEAVVENANDQTRTPAPKIIEQLGKVLEDYSDEGSEGSIGVWRSC